ncbi:MAG: class I SAM-dependent methyltransferase [Proteobacteria bacterium]|nr:class I SAM-dependent methyltransferase [Pseudomonadota bacterium]
MWEQSKAARRRYFDGAFHSTYFVGQGIDIGSGNDPLGNCAPMFNAIESVGTWDIDDGDAQLMAKISSESLDFVHSSHCLEHMRDPREALRNWLRILRPGGHLIVTVPDEDLYELGNWPSRFNSDHKWTFTICKSHSWSPNSINVVDLIREFASQISAERLTLLRDFFNPELAANSVDQTLGPMAECAIEFVWCKR